jgi:hypothetical protein
MDNESNSKKLADIDDGKLRMVHRQLPRKLAKFAVRRAILGPLGYFLVDATPWCASSRSARSLAPTCSPMASRRMRSWHGWQMLPFSTVIGLPQTMHFLVGSAIGCTVPQINKLPIN